MTRHYARNAYETDLASGIDATTTTVQVVSSVGLTEPCFLVIDDESNTVREYIKVTNIAGNTLTVVRALTGSANPSGSAHNAGAKVRSVAVQQWLDEIWNDIEANLAAINVNAGDISQNQTDIGQLQTDVTGKVDKAGDTMTGALVLPADPTADLEASTKKYVDTSNPIASVQAFAGAAAPAGWLLCDGASYPVATYPALHAIIGDTYGGDGGTNFNVPNLVDRSPIGAGAIAALGATAGAETVDIGHVHTMPSHSHTIAHTHSVDPPSTTSASGGSHNHGGNTGANSGGASSIVGGGGEINEPHTHGISSDSGHTHSVNISPFTSGGSSAGSSGSADPGDTNSGGGSKSVVHPVLGLNYIIKAL